MLSTLACFSRTTPLMIVPKNTPLQTRQLVVRSQIQKRHMAGPLVPILLGFKVGSWLTYAGMNYKFGNATSQLVKYRRKDNCIQDVALIKQGFILPWQKHRYINFFPTKYQYHFVVGSHNNYIKSKEDVKLEVSCELILGPYQDEALLAKYLKYLDDIEYMPASWQHLHIAFENSVIKNNVRHYLLTNNYDDLKKDNFVRAEQEISQKIIDAFKSIGVCVYGGGDLEIVRLESGIEVCKNNMKIVNLKEV